MTWQATALSTSSCQSNGTAEKKSFLSIFVVKIVNCELQFLAKSSNNSYVNTIKTNTSESKSPLSHHGKKSCRHLILVLDLALCWLLWYALLGSKWDSTTWGLNLWLSGLYALCIIHYYEMQFMSKAIYITYAMVFILVKADCTALQRLWVFDWLCSSCTLVSKYFASWVWNVHSTSFPSQQVPIYIARLVWGSAPVLAVQTWHNFYADPSSIHEKSHAWAALSSKHSSSNQAPV